ncbi:MAG TPA: type IV secretion system protein [Rickettsiales bacterium]|nr:type IV secretion system protein [Rickettsiales bacterium]
MRKFLRKLCFYFFIVIVFFTNTLNNSFAIVDITRDVNYSVTGENGNQVFSASMSDINPLPYITNSVGDLSIELSNPFCIGYTAAYFVVMYTGSATTRVTATASLLAAAAAIYGTAYFKFKDFEICGANWLVWGNSNKNAGSNIKTYYPELGAFNGSIKRDVINCIKNKSDCDNITKNFMGTRTVFDMKDRVYRERIYDGEEVVNNNCTDPRAERTTYDIEGTGQLYYMKGYSKGNYACDRFLDVDDEDKKDEFEDAYNCCVEASKSVCITDKMSADIETRSAKNIFCNVENGLCTYDAFIFKIFKSKEGEDGVYCAQTYSLCPYNFNIEKGSEKSSYFDKTINFDDDGNIESIDDPCFDSDEDEALSCQGQRKNFYQYRRHCTVIEEWVNVDDYDDNTYAPFIDKACINFVGSSHNTEGYKTYDGYNKLFSRYKSFTAPIAECFTETLKNFLYNRAGHSKCTSGDFPDALGNCEDDFEYEEGDDLLETLGTLDPVSKLIKYINKLLMLTLTLMISLYGYGILVNTVKLTRKDMIITLIKITLVLTFASSIWWREQLFTFIYGLSDTFSSIVSKMGFDDTVDSEMNLIKYDGCYFGNINDILGKEDGEETPDLTDVGENNYYNYPSGRKYIAFFDSLDCKINKYLGYSVGKNLPNLLYVIGLSLIWPFNIGIFLAVASVMMALFVISFAIKTVYIFVASSIALTLMLYISPLIIPCILFNSRKKMFDTWLKNTISFALQPMFLFAYISLSMTIMDDYILEKGLFTGSGPHRELVCGYLCEGTDTEEIVSYGDTYSDADCGDDETTINLKQNSLLCFLEKVTSSPFTVFNSIGIFLSKLSDLQLSDLITFLRVAFLFFILNNVLNTIPGIATNLTGGSANLPGAPASADPFALSRKFGSVGGTASKIFKYGGKTVGRGFLNIIKK